MAATTMGAYRTGGGAGFSSGNTSRANTASANIVRSRNISRNPSRSR